MKRIFTSFLTLCIGFSAFSQSQRTVLIEEGSNASCGPCAAQNPAFKVLLDANTAKAVSLKYQWYFPGFDPMHNHNPAEANGRFETYYGQNGVPTAMIDGTIPSFGGNPYDGAPAGFTQGLIDTRHAVTSPFDIELTYSLTPETITVTATATCSEATAGNFKLRIAVIEEQISFASAPGSNGETDFYNVMKKFLPNADGLAQKCGFQMLRLRISQWYGLRMTKVKSVESSWNVAWKASQHLKHTTNGLFALLQQENLFSTTCVFQKKTYCRMWKA